jgi:hypothetical protein
MVTNHPPLPVTVLEECVVTASAQWQADETGGLLFPSIFVRVRDLSGQPVGGLTVENFQVVCFTRLATFPVDISYFEGGAGENGLGLFSPVYVFGFAFPEEVGVGQLNFSVTVSRAKGSSRRPTVSTGQAVIPVMKLR